MNPLQHLNIRGIGKVRGVTIHFDVFWSTCHFFFGWFVVISLFFFFLVAFF